MYIASTIETDHYVWLNLSLTPAHEGGPACALKAVVDRILLQRMGSMILELDQGYTTFRNVVKTEMMARGF